MFNIKLFVQHYIKKVKGTPDDVLIFVISVNVFQYTHKMFINVAHNIQLPFGNFFCVLGNKNPVAKNINSHNEYKVPPNKQQESTRNVCCCVLKK